MRIFNSNPKIKLDSPPYGVCSMLLECIRREYLFILLFIVREENI